MKKIHLLVPLLLLLALPRPAAGQDARLQERLDEPTRASVARVIESARADGLPTEPLVKKALEGASKGASGPRVVEAVQGLAERMRAARSVLGPATPADELGSAASALYVGVSAADLSRLRAAHRGESLETAYAALAYLVQRGLPVERSVGVIRSMIDANASSVDFVSLQRLVEQDIRAGSTPLDAVRRRVSDLLRRPPTTP